MKASPFGKGRMNKSPTVQHAALGDVMKMFFVVGRLSLRSVSFKVDEQRL